MTDRWNPNHYDDKHGFVTRHGQDLLPLLAPRPGERILDVGCGTGHLTAQIAAAGADVRGIDSSPAMIEQARLNHPALRFETADIRVWQPDAPFDAVFSNAVLHWVKPPQAAVASMAAALRPGGRLVVEFGGHGNVGVILGSMRTALGEFGVIADRMPDPWYYPSIAEYAGLLDRAGFEVNFAVLFDRPTPLADGPAGLRHWVTGFGSAFLESVPAERRDAWIARVEELAAGKLLREGAWTADYRRLRMAATLTSPAFPDKTR